MGRFLSAFAALLSLVAVAPFVLLAASRQRFGSANPLHGVASPLQWERDAIVNALRDPLADDVVIDVIVRSCLVVVWLALVLVAITTALETVHLVRHRGLSLPPIRGLGWAQRVARYIAAGLLVLVPLMTPSATLASVPAMDGAWTDTGRPQSTTLVPTASETTTSMLATCTPRCPRCLRV